MLDSIRYRILFKQYKNKIYNYALYILKDDVDADDVTQEVLIKIWKNMGQFNLNAAKVWIMKTTHNLCLDYLRRRKKFDERKYKINDDQEINLVDMTPSNYPDYRANFINIDEKIKKAIEKLPEVLNSIFVLYEVEGFKYKEISNILNIPLNNVKVYLLRARRKLQEELKDYEKEKVY